MHENLPPYYHPTTICFIDDNYGFLRGIELGLPEHCSYMSFLSPVEALATINQPSELPPLVDRCFSMDSSDASTPIIHLNLNALEQEITHIQRFNRVSVLLVDYAMPAMSGLEFCAAVQDRDIKKVLLTGVADETTAVEAFNAGLIDRYVPKADLASMEKIAEIVVEMQRAYFAQYSARLANNLAINPPTFLTDPVIADYFFSILEKYSIVEYFLVSEPYGYLLLRIDGTKFRFIIQSQEDINAAAAKAEKFHAPSGIISRIQSRQEIAFFSEHPEDYLGGEQYPWSELLFAASHVKGKQDWYLTVVKNPPTDIDFDPSHSSFAEFLRRDRPMV